MYLRGVSILTLRLPAALGIPCSSGGVVGAQEASPFRGMERVPGGLSIPLKGEAFELKKPGKDCPFLCLPL